LPAAFSPLIARISECLQPSPHQGSCNLRNGPLDVSLRADDSEMEPQFRLEGAGFDKVCAAKCREKIVKHISIS
jgi:hypothetical protein